MQNYKNEGTIDRSIRIVLAVIFFLLAFLKFTGVLQVIFIVLGLAMLITGATGSCMLYKPFGISTRKQ